MSNYAYRFRIYTGQDADLKSPWLAIKDVWLNVSLDDPIHPVTVAFPKNVLDIDRKITSLPMTWDGRDRFYDLVGNNPAHRYEVKIAKGDNEATVVLLGITRFDQVVICGAGALETRDLKEPELPQRPETIPTSLSELEPGHAVPWSLVAPHMEGRGVPELICVTKPTPDQPGLLMTGEEYEPEKGATIKDIEKFFAQKYQQKPTSHLGAIHVPTAKELTSAWNSVGETFHLLTHGSRRTYHVANTSKPKKGLAFARQGLPYEKDLTETSRILPMCEVHLVPPKVSSYRWTGLIPLLR